VSNNRGSIVHDEQLLWGTVHAVVHLKKTLAAFQFQNSKLFHDPKP